MTATARRCLSSPSSSSGSALSLLTSLCRSNQGILQQKLILIDLLKQKHGDDNAKTVYKDICPTVKASIGQHVRHSMDHLERATMNAATACSGGGGIGGGAEIVDEIHYDLRRRGGVDEHDIDAAANRIHRVYNAVDELLLHHSEEGAYNLVNSKVNACFMLSGDSDAEFVIPSTAARELGFAAHHGT